MNNLIQKKLEEFKDLLFSTVIEKEDAKGVGFSTLLLSFFESIEQAYQEGLKETAISMDKKGKEWLKSNATEAVDLLEEIREQASAEGAKGKFFNTVEIKERINIPKEIIEQISQEARAEEKERIKEYIKDVSCSCGEIGCPQNTRDSAFSEILNLLNNQDK